MPITSATFVRTTLAVLCFGLLAVIAIVAASIWIAGRTEEFATSLAQVLEIRREAFEVRSLAVDAETGQRGFLLTLDEIYLVPYNQAIAEIEEQLEDLRRTTESYPGLKAPVDRLDGLIATKLRELAATIERARANRLDEALELVRTDEGQATMQQIRAASGEAITESNRLIAERTHDLTSMTRMLIWILLAGGVVIVGIVGGSASVAWRYTQDLVRARAEVLGLNATLEERVRDRTADVARANDEIQRFAYIVSHDLRSPLVNVMGFTSELEASLPALHALADQAADQSEPVVKEARTAAEVDIPEALRFIRSSTTKMDGLINAILKLSREGRRTLAPEQVDMAKLMETNAASVVHRLSESGGEIRIVPPIPSIYSDRLALGQIVGNLIDNAAKYLDPARPGRIVLRGRESPIFVEYEVEDNGRGIAPEDYERVFELFRRAGTQDQPGEGIGLPHVRTLVRRLGGEITLQSQLGEGTTFRIRLPRTPPTPRDMA